MLRSASLLCRYSVGYEDGKEVVNLAFYFIVDGLEQCGKTGSENGHSLEFTKVTTMKLNLPTARTDSVILI